MEFSFPSAAHLTPIKYQYLSLSKSWVYIELAAGWSPLLDLEFNEPRRMFLQKAEALSLE